MSYYTFRFADSRDIRSHRRGHKCPEPSNRRRFTIALAKALDINANARTGGQHDHVVYLIFPNSGNGEPRGLEEILATANQLFEAWGGLDRLNICLMHGAPR
jgi:hypothetical protein